MLRKICITACLLTLVLLQVYASAGRDTALHSRDGLYYRYLDIRNNTDDFREADYRNLNEVLEQIVLLDNRLLDSLEGKVIVYAGYEQALEEKSATIHVLSEELQQERTRTSLYIPLLVSLLFFCLIFISFFIVRSVALKKVRSQLQELNELKPTLALQDEKIRAADKRFASNHELLGKAADEKNTLVSAVEAYQLQLASAKEELAEERSGSKAMSDRMQAEISALKDEIRILLEKIAGVMELSAEEQLLFAKQRQEFADQLNRAQYSANVMTTENAGLRNIIAGQEQQASALQEEIRKLQKRVDALQQQAAEAQTIPIRDEELHRKFDEINLTAVKLEKLESLRQKGILDAEEYASMKKIFLGEL